MSALKNTVLSVLIVCLCAAVGYLGVQYAALQTAWNQQQSSGQDQNQNQYATLNEEISQLKAEIDQYKTLLTTEKTQWQARLDELKTSVENDYLPRRPDVRLKKQIFTYNPGSLTAEASVKDLIDWKQNNFLYYDSILRESLVLEYNPTYRNVVVAEIAPGSIFAQMGFKVGDRILNVNGAILNRGDELRSRLLEPTKTNVNLVRNDQKMSLAINYQYPSDWIQTSSLTSEKIKVSDVNVDNKKAIKIVDVNSEVPVFQKEDVIVSVDGKAVTASDFFQTFKSKDSVSLDIIRNGTTQKIDVAVSNTPFEFK